MKPSLSHAPSRAFALTVCCLAAACVGASAAAAADVPLRDFPPLIETPDRVVPQPAELAMLDHHKKHDKKSAAKAPKGNKPAKGDEAKGDDEAVEDDAPTPAELERAKAEQNGKQSGGEKPGQDKPAKTNDAKKKNVAETNGGPKNAAAAKADGGGSPGDKAAMAKNGDTSADGGQNDADSGDDALAAPKLRPIAATDEPMPVGKPGECYVRVRQPAVMETVSEKVMVTPASSRIEVIPAVFEEAEEKVLVRPETKRYELVPAEFKAEKKPVTTRPKHMTLSAVAAKFEASPKKIVKTPARTEWKKGRNPLSKTEGSFGSVWCLVERPAEMLEVSVSKLIAEPSVQTQPVGAETTEVDVEVLVKPASVKEVTEPAVYKTVKVRKLKTPAAQKSVSVPAEYQTVERQVVKTPESVVWRRVLCDTNVTEAIVKQLERKLKDAGHDPGAIDGMLGPGTMKAVESYQEAEGLPVGGLTYEVLERLGVEL